MKKQVMQRAWAMYKAAGCHSRYEFSLALKTAWAEARAPKETKNVTIAWFDAYNFRRYSDPWVATIKDGKYDFNNRVGAYTGKYHAGEAGSLVVTCPETDVIYAYGQKDNRGRNTVISYAIWDGSGFVSCDKFGRMAA